MSTLSSFVSRPGNDLQSRFLSVLPRIEDQARFYFRSVNCAVRRADCIAETIAVSWKWFCRLAHRGKDATQFAAALAHLAARAVRAGRRLGAGERVNDVMSPLAQRRYGFVVQSLPPTRRAYEDLQSDGFAQRIRDVMEERLRGNAPRIRLRANHLIYYFGARFLFSMPVQIWAAGTFGVRRVPLPTGKCKQ